MFQFDSTQVRNGLTVLSVVHAWAAAGRWPRWYSRVVGRACIQCALTESDLYNDANPNVPGSVEYAHDTNRIGTDHASVGVFQQQVPLWGPVSECQNVTRATEHFLSALLPLNPNNVAMEIQRVQVSAFKDGSNYHANRDRALAFMDSYWNTARSPRRVARALHNAA